MSDSSSSAAAAAKKLAVEKACFTAKKACFNVFSLIEALNQIGNDDAITDITTLKAALVKLGTIEEDASDSTSSSSDSSSSGSQA